MNGVMSLFKKIAVVAVICSAMPIHAMDGLLKVPQAQSTADICRGLVSQYPLTCAFTGGAAAVYGGHKLYQKYFKEINSFIRTLQKHKSSLAILAIALAPRITFLQNNAYRSLYKQLLVRFQVQLFATSCVFFLLCILKVTGPLALQLLYDPTQPLLARLMTIPFFPLAALYAAGIFSTFLRVFVAAPLLLTKPATCKAMIATVIILIQRRLNLLIKSSIAQGDNSTFLKILTTLNGIETDLYTDALSLPKSKVEFLGQIKKLLPDRTQIPATPLLFSLLSNNRQLALWLNKQQATLKPLEQFLQQPIHPMQKKAVNDFLAMLMKRNAIHAGLTNRIPVEIIEQITSH